MELSGTQDGLTLLNATATAWETSQIPMNGSDFTPYVDTEDLVLSSLTAIFALAGLVGNTVVLWLLGFRMKRNSFSVYILNLAGADFLFLCCQVVRSLQRLTSYFHSIFMSIPSFVMTVLTFAYIAGLSFLTAVSTERCLSILWPIWYRCRRPRHTSAAMCALLWALSLLLSTLEGENCGFLFKDYVADWCRVFDFVTAAWLIFLFVILSGSSLALLTRLLCGSQRVQLTRLYVILMFTVLVFLLCGLPFGIYWFLLFWTHFTSDSSFQFSFDADLYLLSFYLQLVSHVLSCINSCANPVIYFFVGSFRQRLRKRRTLRLVLQRALQDFPEEDEYGGRLPQETQEMSGSSLVS